MRSRWFVVLGACAVLGSLAACLGSNDSSSPSGPTVDASPLDVTLPPGSDSAPPSPVEAGADAGGGGCSVQAALAALGADAGGTVVANDFTCPDGIDVDASTAALDFTGTGFARAAQPRVLEAPGDGGEGAYASDGGGAAADGGLTTLSAGVHQYTSFDLEDALTFANGDLTIDVAGPFTLGNGSGKTGTFYVQGNLTIVASGPITICADIEVAGNVTIHQPTAAGITVGCKGSGATPAIGSVNAGASREAGTVVPGLTPISAGDIDVSTRGPITFTYGWIGSGAFGTGAQARSGNVTLRAYGDVSLGFPPSTWSYVYVSDPPCTAHDDAGGCTQYGTNGDLQILSEGTITFDDQSYAYGGNQSYGAGGNVSLRGAAGVKLLGGSFVYAGYSGALEVVSQGDVLFDHGSYGYAGSDTSATHDVTVRARNVTLDNISYVYAEGNGGSVTLAATGNVTLDHRAYAYAADAQCKPGGSLDVRAKGNIAITNGAYVYAGNSDTGQGCTPVGGGNVTLRAGGAITAPVPDAGTPPATAGKGSPAGTVTQTAGTPVAIGLLDVRLETSSRVVSKPMPSGSSAVLFGATGATVPTGFFGAHVLVSPDGSDAAFAPIEDALGAALSAGWRYEVLLQPRMFDPSAVDGVVVRVQ
jgi:hypothetical protein